MYKNIITLCIIIITINNTLTTYQCFRPQNLPNEELQLEQLQKIELIELQ